MRHNSAASSVLYGESGETAINSFEYQEVSVFSLQLSLMYTDTPIIKEVLDTVDWSGQLTEEDMRRLIPLIYNHVNFYGHFESDMSKRLPFDDAQPV